MTRTADDFDVCVADIAFRLRERLPQVVSSIADLVQDEIEELRDDALTELLYAGAEGNVATVLHALQCGIAVQDVDAPTAALEHARRLAQQGVPINTLVRAYRLGQRRMNELVFAELQAIDMAERLRYTVLEKITATLFAFIDRVSEQVVAAYEEEREQWLATHNSIRFLRVRELLAARAPIDVDAASEAVGYPLRWHHLALVMWYPTEVETDELARLQRLVRELGAAADASAAPLFIPTDRRSGWAWLPYRSAPDDAVAAVRRFLVKRDHAPIVAVGTPAAGVDGFCVSHQRALAARTVAAAARDRTPAVVAATDPGLMPAALLGGNLEQSRGWVKEVLGGLAADTANDARLRDTLRVFLGCGSSFKTAAEELSIHSSTVKYRVRCAIDRRGRPIGADRLDVELALLLCHWYGSPS
ncbi:helix-turn-helix domain-containing protein [Mycobacterium sp. 663a-19]|uniref:helix-turn-helix domain-containing protein n=1 Tax=Mycobacterium sp. 663a-19 TaxID=2986148 RepID=UPI002D1E940D|nr:helix-turn-helix domain-containing protein [Mycobacterium sp. 663a-19]MEB3983292.1 helix-turn-helix domain-containing protein [Mycobacterium sp. 663a-19]